MVDRAGAMAGRRQPSTLLLAGVEIKQECRTLTKPSKAAAELIPQLKRLIFFYSFKWFGDAYPRGLFTGHTALAGDLWVGLVDESDEYQRRIEPGVFCR